MYFNTFPPVEIRTACEDISLRTLQGQRIDFPYLPDEILKPALYIKEYMLQNDISKMNFISNFELDEKNHLWIR